MSLTIWVLMGLLLCIFGIFLYMVGIYSELRFMRKIVQQREEFIQKETERKRRYYETRNSEFTPRRGL